MKILAVTKDSVADELGIRAGEELVSFDGFPVVDVLDYDFYNSREHFTMCVRSAIEEVDYEIDKYDDEDLGLELSRDIPVRSCRNHCVFCFVDQLPPEDLRNTLRVKDDDYRHSFIFGNYVTLTNVSDRELARIVRLKLSPLYVSVHTSDHRLRCEMLGLQGKKAPDINEQLKTLHAGGITVHAQIVYCPEINEDIDKTIADISPYTASLAIVPVGLTKNGNPALRRVDADSARRVIAAVEKWQNKLLALRGTRYVFAADEFYMKANVPVPPYEAYEDFSQIENGIGLVAAFRHDFDTAMQRYESGHVGSVSLATGVSAYPLICECAAAVQKKFGGEIRVYRIDNRFFGESVTVAGLLVGKDLKEQLRGKPLGEKLLLPRIMLRELGDVFLDGCTVNELSRALGVPVQMMSPDGESFVKALIGVQENA